MSPTKKVLIALGVLAVVAVVLALVMGGGEEGEAVEVAQAERRTLTQTVTASGKVRPEVEVKLSSDVSGEIVFLGVEEGDRVQAGQVLVRVQPEFYASQREQAQAGLLQAQADAARTRAELLRAEDNLRRQEQLHGRGAIADADLEAARTQAKVAEAAQEAAEYRIRSAQASLRQAGDQLSRTTIVAPISGTVSQLNVEPGERVVGTAQMSGTEILRIAELDEMEIEVDVNENDVVNISVGDTARVEVDAYPGRPFRGVVTQIANSARVAGAGTQEQVTNFPVKVKILDAHNAEGAPVLPASDEGTDGGAAPLAENVPPGLPTLRPGMSGTVDIFTTRVENVVAVPIQAVTVRDIALDDTTRRDEDLREVVFVMEADTARRVVVQTGIADATHIEVASGLVGGETVIVGPFRLLRTDLEEGAKVRVEEEERGGRPGGSR